MINGYIDIFKFKAVKFFAGAGIGAVQLKEKITLTTVANFGGRNSTIIDQSTSTKIILLIHYCWYIGKSY